jgi:hypothetical protein
MRTEHFITIKRCNTEEVCPVLALQEYVFGARKLGIDLDEGYIFRNTNSKGYVLDQHLAQPAVNKRLALYMNMLGIHESETSHSLRGGCAVLLKQCHQSDNESARYVGWKNKDTWDLYSRSKTIEAERASATISNCFDNEEIGKQNHCLSRFGFSQLPKFNMGDQK